MAYKACQPRVRSLKWEFSTICLNTFYHLQNTVDTVPLQKSGSPVEKFQHTTRAKTKKQTKKSRTKHIEKGKIKFHFTCHTLSPQSPQQRTRRDFLNLWFLPWEKIRACKWAPSFPSCVGHCQRDPFHSYPTQNTKVLHDGREWLKEHHRSQKI